MNFLNALKGVTGQYEIIRLLGAFGVVVFIVTAPGFEAFELYKNGHFDLIGYCASFPTGLGAALGVMGGSISVKDRNVAVARQTANNPPPSTVVTGDLNASKVDTVNIQGQHP